jgi:integrase
VPHQFEQAKIKGQKEKASKRLSKAIEQFIKENVGDGVWAPRSLIDYKNRLALLQAVMGDCFLSEIDHDKIRDFFDKIKRLPPNRTKIKAYKGKCVTELLKMNLSPDKCMTGQTINNVMATVSGFFQWATNRDLLKKNYAAGFSVKQTRRPDESRESFKADELKKLFLVITKRDANYWIPLIGLFSGARLEEICQLHISDIRQEKGVWIFDVNNEGEKRLKTPSSKRIVPIHTALIEKGLIEYVKEIKSKGHQRLFPFLKQVKGKYGHYQSRQFSEQLKKLGIKQSGRNISFHSLRHTFLTAAKFADLPISYIQEMVGHSSGSLTYGTYGKRYDVQKLKEIIDQIRFELD